MNAEWEATMIPTNCWTERAPLAAVSADSRAELFGRPLSSLTATWFRTSPVL